MDIKKEYERWLENATADANVAAELKTLDNAKIEDAFYRDLAFGTGGLRGVIGAGTNRMNIYTVAKASQGLADYLKKNFAEPSVAIGYDSRIKSDVYLMGLTTYGKYETEDQVNFTVYVPKVDEHFVGSLAVIPLQLLGYYVSVAKGLDVDKPRNLAKSVTVE